MKLTRHQIRRWTETSASTLHGELTPSDDGSCSGSSDPDRVSEKLSG